SFLVSCEERLSLLPSMCPSLAPIAVSYHSYDIIRHCAKRRQVPRLRAMEPLARCSIAVRRSSSQAHDGRRELAERGLQVGAGGGEGNAETGIEAEGRARHHGDPRLLEEIGRQLPAVGDRRAVGRLRADEARAVREGVERPFGRAQPETVDGAEGPEDQRAAGLIFGERGLYEVLRAGEGGDGRGL